MAANAMYAVQLCSGKSFTRSRGHCRAGLYPTDSSSPSSRFSVSSPIAPSAMVPENSTAVIAQSYDSLLYSGPVSIGERSMETDRGHMSWVEAGAGWPVILLHAFPLEAAMWRPQLECVPQGWRFIAPDLRGFGRSVP